MMHKDGRSGKVTGGAPVLQDGGDVNPQAWEEAYQRFETPEEEIRKFIRRLRGMGADQWPRDAAIVELFCGRGNGLRALERLGFYKLEGADLSPTLAKQYKGVGTVHVADCRALPFADESQDVAIVQGGLHHLPQLPGDLEKTLAEVKRVLVRGGQFVVVEPWKTPFLRAAHGLCRVKLARKSWGKVDALATMIEYERRTYEQWLSQPQAILVLLKEHFEVKMCEQKWGKLRFVGVKG